MPLANVSSYAERGGTHFIGHLQVLPAKLMSNRNAYVKTMIFRWKPDEISIEFAEVRVSHATQE